jgi:hypothetical protein
MTDASFGPVGVLFGIGILAFWHLALPLWQAASKFAGRMRLAVMAGTVARAQGELPSKLPPEIRCIHCTRPNCVAQGCVSATQCNPFGTGFPCPDPPAAQPPWPSP